MKRLLALATAAIAGLVFASSALANSLTCGHGVTCTAGVGGGNTPMTGTGTTLPFTGLDLAAVALVAALLLVSGLVLRRVGRRRS